MSSSAKVLVHCVGRGERSATLVLAYLMLRQQLSLRQGGDHREERRWSSPAEVSFTSSAGWTSSCGVQAGAEGPGEGWAGREGPRLGAVPSERSGEGWAEGKGTTRRIRGWVRT